MTDSMKSYAYSFSILFIAMMVRGLVGMSHPELPLEGTVVTGATTVLLLAPILYRFVYGENLLASRPEQVKYACLAGLAVAGFGYFVIAA